MSYQISDIYSKRIDISKTVSLIMVLFIHAQTLSVNVAGINSIYNSEDIGYFIVASIQYLISTVIASSAVPLFFFVSGVLLYRKSFSWKKNIQNKSKSLLVPFLLCNTFWIAVMMLAQSVPWAQRYFTDSSNIIINFGLYEWLDAYFAFSGYPFAYHLWFLIDLFVLNIVAFPLKKVFEKRPKTCFALLAVLWFMPICDNVGLLHKTALIFFALGYFFVSGQRTYETIDKIQWSYSLTLFITLLVVIVIIHSYEHGFLQYLSYLLLQCIIPVGCILIIKLSKCIYSCERLRSIFTKLSGPIFFIYLYHELTLTILKKATAALFMQTPITIMLEYIILPIAVYALCFVAASTIKKLLPRAYLLITGSR